MRFGEGDFICLDGQSVKNHHLMEGDELKKKSEVGLEDGDRLLAIAQRERPVSFAGPLAGYHAGPVDVSGASNPGDFQPPPNNAKGRANGMVGHVSCPTDGAGPNGPIPVLAQVLHGEP